MNVSDSIEIIRQANQSATVKVKVGDELHQIDRIDLDGDYRDPNTQVIIKLADAELVTPIVNNNGTSGEALIAQRREVFEALGDALQKLKDMSPHGRDYQTDTTGTAFKAAVRQHRRRLKTIEQLRAEMHEEASAIMERR